MLENIKGSSDLIKGLFVMGAGITVVFITLIVFFFLIKLLGKMYPEDSDPFMKRVVSRFGRKNV